MTSSVVDDVPEMSRESVRKSCDFADYQKSLLRGFMDVTVAATKLPSSGQEYDYYSSFSLFSRVMRAEANEVLKMMSAVAAHQIGKQNVFEYGLGDMEEKIELLVEVNDILLERAGFSIDRAKGIKKSDTSDIQLATVSKRIDTIWNRKNEMLKQVDEAPVSFTTTRSIKRPQLSFVDKIENSNTPFVPIIREKPHALKPLAILKEKDDEGVETFSHPYEFEIESFKPSAAQMKVCVREPLPLSETPLVMVNTQVELKKMVTDVCAEKWIAIDLEHHSYRSFQGFTCLIQISTWKKDYVIDALLLRKELCCLNEVTADPSIVKVLHGANSDVMWLQRDFGVYVVNLFDTSIAAKLLNFERLSLSFLLKHYVSVETDKRYQLVDWRIRPLSEEMLQYARTDTHFLLPIFEKMKNDLFNASNEQGNLLKATWNRSALVCLRRYERPRLTETSHMQLLRVSHKKFNEKQMYALKHIYAWRDRLARAEDESIGFVLPNHMLLHISELLPREIQGIIACCNPCSPLVKQHLTELHQIILKAREISIGNPIHRTQKLDIPVSSALLNSYDLDNELHVIHDLLPSFANEGAHLPVLLGEDGAFSNFDNDNTYVSARGKSFLTPAPVGPLSIKSKLFPNRRKDLMKSSFSRQYFRFRGPQGQRMLYRTVTPYERYLKEIQRCTTQDEAITKLLEEAKANVARNVVCSTPHSGQRELAEDNGASSEFPNMSTNFVKSLSVIRKPFKKEKKKTKFCNPSVSTESTQFATSKKTPLTRHGQKDFYSTKLLKPHDYAKTGLMEGTESGEFNRPIGSEASLHGFEKGTSQKQQAVDLNRRQFDDTVELRAARITTARPSTKASINLDAVVNPISASAYHASLKRVMARAIHKRRNLTGSRTLGKRVGSSLAFSSANVDTHKVIKKSQ